MCAVDGGGGGRDRGVGGEAVGLFGDDAVHILEKRPNLVAIFK